MRIFCKAAHFKPAFGQKLSCVSNVFSGIFWIFLNSISQTVSEQEFRKLSHLSPQDHYDWGLRAIKSVLVVAGALKRSDRGRPEDQVLMRALRDFNIPKIVTDDLPVFKGLIGDLFPAMDVPRKRDLDFEADIKKAVLVNLNFCDCTKK